MHTRPPINLKSLVYRLHIGALLIIVGLFIRYDWLIITTPFQIEYREGAQLAQTAALMRGINPYTGENHPLLMNIYGLFDNLVVTPFAFLFGNTLLLHRLIGGAAIFASALLIMMVLVRKKVCWSYAISAGVLFLSFQLFYITPTARPNAPGLLLFLLAILLPWDRGYSAKSLAASIGLGLFAFLTKPYFILAVVYLGVYLFLFVSKKKAVFYSASVGLVFFASFAIILYTSPFYFYDTLYANFYYGGKNWQYMILQVSQFFVLFGVVLGLAALFSDWKAVFQCLWRQKKLTWQLINLNWNAPFLNLSFDLPALSFLLSMFLVIISFGQHMGSYMNYLYELMAPFLSIILMKKFSERPRFYMFQLPGILFNLILIIWLVYPYGLAYNYHDYEQPFDQLRQIVVSSQNVYNSPAVMSQMVEYQKPFTNTGQYELYFIPTVPRLFFLPGEEEVIRRGNEFRDQISQSINNKSYGVIMITVEDNFSMIDQKILEKNYRYERSIKIKMPATWQEWEIAIWYPK